MPYSKGAITIPNVTGNIEITVTTQQATPQPIELYTGNASDYQLNKKYSGTSIVDYNGNFVTNIIPVDLSVRPYLCVDGAYCAAQSQGLLPQFYKIAFYKNGSMVGSPIYTDFGGANDTQWNANLSQYASTADSIQMQIGVVNRAISASDVPTTSSLSIKLSTTALY